MERRLLGLAVGALVTLVGTGCDRALTPPAAAVETAGMTGGGFAGGDRFASGFTSLGEIASLPTGAEGGGEGTSVVSDAGPARPWVEAPRSSVRPLRLFEVLETVARPRVTAEEVPDLAAAADVPSAGAAAGEDAADAGGSSAPDGGGVEASTAEKARDPRVFFSRLLEKARTVASGVSRDCYRTAVRLANLNGARGNGDTWRSDITYRGRALLSGLREAIEGKVLRPGMVIYASMRPGTDPRSLNLANKPHWFTYLGRDGNGTPRFSDQYDDDYSLSEIAATYGSRRIDEFLDPYAL